MILIVNINISCQFSAWWNWINFSLFDSYINFILCSVINFL